MTCAYEQVQTWLMDLSPSNANRLSLDDEGYCFLNDAEKGVTVLVSALKNADHFVLAVDLFPIHEGNRADIFEKALTLNLYQGATGGGALAFDKAGNMLVFNYLRKVNDTDSGDFRNMIANIIDRGIELRKELIEASSRVFTSAPADAPLQFDSAIKI